MSQKNANHDHSTCSCISCKKVRIRQGKVPPDCTGDVLRCVCQTCRDERIRRYNDRHVLAAIRACHRLMAALVRVSVAEDLHDESLPVESDGALYFLVRFVEAIGASVILTPKVRRERVRAARAILKAARGATGLMVHTEYTVEWARQEADISRVMSRLDRLAKEEPAPDVTV